MLRNESANSTTKAALGEQEILAAVEALAHVEAVGASLNRKVIQFITQSKSVDLIASLANHGDVEVRRAVASNLNLPEELAWKLAEDAEFCVRARLAENSSLAKFLLETLAEDEDDRIAERATRTLDRLESENFPSKVIHWMFSTRLITKRIG